MYDRGSARDNAGFPSVSIIIVNWNGLQFLPKCLESINSLDYPAARLETIMVDNNSSDGSVDYVSSNFPGVRILQLAANYGFCYPNNRGADMASGEYLAFLNNDTEAAPGWLRALVEPAVADSQVVSCASKILYSDRRDTVNAAGGKLTIIGGGFYRGYGDKDGPLYDQPCLTSFGCAAGVLVRRDFFLEIGGFDEDHFAACEEHDLGWKAWLYGHSVAYAPRAVLYHRESGTFASRSNADSQKVFLNTRNRLYNIVKNVSNCNIARALFISLIFNTYRWLAYLFNGNWKAAAALCRGHADFLRNLKLMLPKRRVTQSKRKRSDGELFRLGIIAGLWQSIKEESRLRRTTPRYY